MTDRFEQAIADFFDRERIASTELINLSEEPKVTNRDLANNLDFNLKHLLLLSRVSIRQFHLLNDRLDSITSKVDSIVEEQKRINKKIRKIEEEQRDNKPLSATEVRHLVKEIAQQPKLVEEQALKLTTDLDQKLLRVEKLLEEVRLLAEKAA